MKALEGKLMDVSRKFEDAMKQEKEKPVQTEPAKPAPAPAPQPMNLIVNVDARKDEVKKRISIQTDADGNITGADVVPEDEDDDETEKKEMK
jgi:hypothetical protein